jgi:hypothetical protein
LLALLLFQIHKNHQSPVDTFHHNQDRGNIRLWIHLSIDLLVKSSVMSQEGKFIPTGGKKVFFSCSYCQRDITQQIRIQCAVCDHFDLCGDCFAAGVSRYPHVNTHDYRVVDCIDIPIFTFDWTISEELLLLEGIDKCGCGNWKTIADYIGNKTLKQVEEHYWEVYMGVHGQCLPSKTILNDELVSTQSIISSSSSDQNVYHTQVMNDYTRGEEVVRDKNKETVKNKEKQMQEIRDRYSKLS